MAFFHKHYKVQKDITTHYEVSTHNINASSTASCNGLTYMCLMLIQLPRHAFTDSVEIRF